MQEVPLRVVMGGACLAELFEFLSYHKKSGTLEVRSAHNAKRLALAAGRLYRMDGVEAQDLLEDAAEALFALGEGGMREAEFTPADYGDAEPPANSVALSQLLARLEELDAAWREIRADLPTMECRLALSPKPIGQGAPMTLESCEWAVVFALARPATLADVCRELGGRPLEAARVVHGMVKKGLVDVVEVVRAGEDTAVRTAEQGGDPIKPRTGAVPAGWDEESEPEKLSRPAELLVHGVTDVLAEVTAEMTGISKGDAKKGILAGSLENTEPTEPSESAIPPEWQAYYSRLNRKAEEGSG